jgi:phage shock protein C
MKKLLRSSNRILGGVCGGIAEYFDVDPTVIRVAYALLSFFSAAFPGIVLYIILLVLIPDTQQIDNQ